MCEQLKLKIYLLEELYALLYIGKAGDSLNQKW